jgi:spermidine/putrescine transport system ATP-binding protein
VQLRRRRALGLASRRRQFEGQAITASVRLETLGFHADRPETANTLRRYAVARTVLGIRMAMWVAVKETQNAVLRAYVYPPTGTPLGDGADRSSRDRDRMAGLDG